MHSHTKSQLKSLENFLEVGRIGKTVGLKGALKLHNKSDFPEQFKSGAKFYLKNSEELIIKSYDANRGLVIFEKFEDINLAKNLVNKILYSTKADTLKTCKLQKDEYFYFDILGLEIVENEEILGKVTDIMEAAINYFLQISTSQNLVDEKLPKEFFLPYIDKYIQKVDLDEKKIFVKDAKAILLNS